jgi:hypothetical protein
MPRLEYPVIIEPLPEDEGGGFVALVPDLPGWRNGRNRACILVQDAAMAWQVRSGR